MIEEKDIERLKEIFVTRQECQKATDAFDSKLNKDNVRLAVIETEMKQIKWLTAAVIGDNPECDWQGRLLVDNYGREIMEEVEEFRTFVDPETKERK